MKWIVAACLGTTAGLIVALKASRLACERAIACIPVDVVLVWPLVAGAVIVWLGTRPDRTFRVQVAAAIIWVPVHIGAMDRYGPGVCDDVTSGVCTPEPYMLTLGVIAVAAMIMTVIEAWLRRPRSKIEVQ